MSGTGGRAGLIEYLWIAAFAVAGLLLAVFASEELCGTDGSFALDDPGAIQSGYCEAAHFPGFPNSLGGWLLVGGLNLGPSLVAVAGVVLATRRRHPRFRSWGFALAAMLFVAVTFFTLVAAEVDYEGLV